MTIRGLEKPRAREPEDFSVISFESSNPRILKSSVLSVSSLSLHHFRNYSHAHIETEVAPIVLVGHNGAGKTNVLEAISLLLPGRGLRSVPFAQMDNQQAHTPWAVAAVVQGMQGEVKIGTGRLSEGAHHKRQVKIDGKLVRAQSELTQHMTMIWLTPSMDQLFNESATTARKFLDRLVYGFDPEHAARVQEYEFAMRERNRILQGAEHDPAWLGALEQTMAETGVAMADARLQAAAKINHAIRHSLLSFPKADVQVLGYSEDQLAGGEKPTQVEAALQAALQESRKRDAAAGRALLGPHRSEMQVMHLERSMPAQLCSMGEQKALLLSIILAQARAVAALKGIIPILLLDEIITHLDATRRLELFKEICQIGAQTWMTGTDANLFTDLEGSAQFFRIENGNIF